MGIGEGSSCPDCGAAASVVTAVTVATLGDSPRMILVTRQCARCGLKYPVMRAEPELGEDERERWRNP